MKKLLLISLLSFLLAPIFAEDVKVYMMQPDGSLYTENEDGEMIWKQTSYVGAEFTVLKLKDEKGKETNALDEKDAKRKSGGKMIDCHVYHVLYDNAEYYVLSDRVSTDKDFSIVSKETAIYRSPDYADIYDKTLAVGTFVTFGSNNTELPAKSSVKNITKGFKKIHYFDENSYTIKTGYVKQENLNTQKDDLKVLQILSKLKGTKDSSIKKELLSNVENLIISEGISALLENEKQVLLNYDLTAGGIEEIPMYAATITCLDDEKINIRDLPGLDGKVVCQYENGTVVCPFQKTKLKGAANGTTNYWYYIYDTEGENKVGWVYGDFLVFSNNEE